MRKKDISASCMCVLRVWCEEDLCNLCPSQIHFGVCHCLTVHPSVIHSYDPSQSLCLSRSLSYSVRQKCH